MFKYEPAQIRLFISSLVLTLVLVATLGAFYVVYLGMVDMGIATDLPTVVTLSDSGLIIASDDGYRLISTIELNELFQMRRAVDPLTMPRPLRLLIKLLALAEL